MLLPSLSLLLQFLQVSFSCYMEGKWHSPAVRQEHTAMPMQNNIFSSIFLQRVCLKLKGKHLPVFYWNKAFRVKWKGQKLNRLSTCNFALLRSLGGGYTNAASTYLQALRRFQPGSTFRHGHHVLCRSPQKRPKACQTTTGKDWKCSQDQGIGKKGWLWKPLLDLMSQKDNKR